MFFFDYLYFLTFLVMNKYLFRNEKNRHFNKKNSVVWKNIKTSQMKVNKNNCCTALC